MRQPELFDEWPEAYDRWFETPIGQLVREYESALLLDLLQPAAGERILDAGCGTGEFTRDVLASGARVMGVELSLPMLVRAGQKLAGKPFHGIRGDMRDLPFVDRGFDKVISVTAIEFIEDAEAAVGELFRVTRPGGCVVVATLNRLSPWAARRKAQKGHPIFEKALFRSPEEMRACAPVKPVIRTAVHFAKDDDPVAARAAEREAQAANRDTGAFLVVRWQRP